MISNSVSSESASVSIRLRSVGPEKSGQKPEGEPEQSFNPSPVCGTGEISGLIPPGMAFSFQSVSGLWDRRNDRGLP